MKHELHNGACSASMKKSGGMRGMEIKTIQSPLAVKPKPRKIGGR